MSMKKYYSTLFDSTIHPDVGESPLLSDHHLGQNGE